MKQGDKVRIIASKEELTAEYIDVNMLQHQFYTVEMVADEWVWVGECGYGFKMSMLEVQ